MPDLFRHPQIGNWNWIPAQGREYSLFDLAFKNTEVLHIV